MAGRAEEKRPWITSPLRTIAQVARRLGVSRDTVVGYVDAGDLPAADMSVRGRGRRRALRFRDDDIEQFEEKKFRETVIARSRRNTRRSG